MWGQSASADSLTSPSNCRDFTTNRCHGKSYVSILEANSTHEHHPKSYISATAAIIVD